MTIDVVDADITTLEVDAVVNAANDHLWMGSGVAGAIKRVGGVEIEQEAVALGPIAVGDAVATTAGRLAAKHVIHGAVMGQDLNTDAATIARTTRSCLELAQELGAKSIALPALGTGVGGVSPELAAGAMVDTARALEPGSLDRIVFAVYGRDTLRAFKAAVGA